jgi:hypothetical protein
MPVWRVRAGKSSHHGQPETPEAETDRRAGIRQSATGFRRSEWVDEGIWPSFAGRLSKVLRLPSQPGGAATSCRRCHTFYARPIGFLVG